MVTVVTMVAIRADGSVVEPGDELDTFRGERCWFVRADAVTVPGKAGKVTVTFAEGDVDPFDNRGYFYASVVGLTVHGMMSCGCPAGPDHGWHLEGCATQ